MKTVKIRNNTNAEKIWLKTFIANEEYTIPTDNSLLFKYSNLDVLLTAIANGEASIGDGSSFFSTVSEQINYLKGMEGPKDLDGAAILRPKAAKAGWTYHLNGIEFETSVLNSILHKDIDGNNLNETAIKFYDANNAEITTQGELDTDCVKTVLTYEPPYDIEIIGGTVKTQDAVTEDVRLWVVAVPDVAYAYGGSRVMVNNINLKFIDPNNGIEADGRVSKYLAYNATYHTNKLQVTLKHPPGYKLKLCIAFEIFKA